MSAAVEWVALPDGARIVATAERAWQQRPQFGQPDLFAEPMTHAGQPATTGRLLDGAIAAGLAMYPPAPAPEMSPDRWAWHLAGYYHLTHSTPSLLEQTAARFTAAGRPALAEWALEKARDETAHDRLALRDLAALGFDGEALVAAVVPPTAAAMLDAFRAAAAEPLPLGVLAYAHVVERLALTLDQAHIDSIKACLPPKIDATRCLRVHSAIGSDAAHVAENVHVVAGLPAAERAEIALACFRITAIWSGCNSIDRAKIAWTRAVLDHKSRR